MTRIVLILLLVLLIIIALNYKKIKYNKTYKKCLSRIRDFIDSQTKSKKKSNNKSNKKSKHNKKQKEVYIDNNNDDITISDVLDESNMPNVNLNDDNISLLSDISTIDMNSLDSKDKDSVLSFD